MKINILYIILVIQYAMAFGQGSFEIKPTSVWKIDKLINVISKKDKRCEGDETFKLFVKGDTIINALNYFKIYKSGVLYLDSIIEYTNQYNGAIRQVDKKVYYIEKSKSTEVLLYDFEIKIGDTIKGLIANGKIVLDIDTLNDGRKLFQISKSMLHAMDAYIIEGIGTSGGLLSEPPVGHYMYDDCYLICYSENNVIKYNGNDPLNDGCYLSSSRFPINPAATWKIYKYTLYLDENEQLDEIYQYFISGDTTLNSMDYYKLFKSGVMYYDTDFYYKGIYVGAIRDDTNKIFYVKKGGTSEVQLFDFNLKLGDTIESVVAKGRIIDHIDTLTDGRKILENRFMMHAGCTSKILLLEGIGHIGGIMEEPPCQHIGYSGSCLACFSVNGIPVYQNSELYGTDCGPISGISHKIKNIFLKIYPVPVKDYMTIDLINNSNQYAIFNIYDIAGEVCLTQKLILNKNKYQFNLSFLKTGMYIVRINSNNSCFVSKLIKE